MESERLKRYKEKLGLITERLADVSEWVAGAEIMSDKRTRLAVYKAFQELAEAAFDVVAMACKDSKLVPKDDYANIDALREKHILDERLRDGLPPC